MAPLQIVLIVLIPFAALRLTRLVTIDKITELLVIRHIRKRAVVEYDETTGLGIPKNLAGYLIELLDCPFCAGFWVSLVVVIVGGLDSISGALIGAILVGLIEAWAGTFLGGEYKMLATFGLLMLVLLVRPYGLFGTVEIERL